MDDPSCGRLEPANAAIHRSDYLFCDDNGNDQDRLDLDFMQAGESFIDPDSLSMVSDYSEMGFQIKQSIRFSDMIMSTYADLKNPSKSITQAPSNIPDPDLAFRKYNMLNLALEFSRWKDCQPETSINDPMSDYEIRLSKEDSTDDTAMESVSPSILSDFSSIDQCLEGLEVRFDNSTDRSCSSIMKSPLQIHIDQKFDSCFRKDRISSESDSCDESCEMINRAKIMRPAWAQSIFHRETLARMPQTIIDFSNSITGFDLSKDKYLWMLNVSQLQLIMNSLMTQIEELNESLVLALIMRDELKSEQANLVVNVESLTMRARNLAQYWKHTGHRTAQITQSTNAGPMHKLISGFLNTPRATTNRFLSFFSPSSSSKLPKPEFV